MESFLSRYKNLICLAVVLMAQLIGLAAQVKADAPQGSVSLMRTWTVAVITPFQKLLVNTNKGIRNVWTGYFYLRGVRDENRRLREQIEQMRLEQVRMQQDAQQGRRLQTLLGFKEQFVSETVAAQVIGTSGSEQSRLLYIDKGARDGLAQDMAVIAPGGIVGKILRVFPSTSQVLMINDQISGVGATLEKTRLQGILSGTPDGAVILKYIMKDEKIQVGDQVVTSGGERIFPKGLPIGTVADVSEGGDLFLNIRVKPSVNINGLEEVLVVTQVVERAPTQEEMGGPIRAADILAQRLPGVPSPTPTPSPAPGASAAPAAGATAAQGVATRPAPATTPRAALPGATPNPTAPAAANPPATPRPRPTATPAAETGAPTQ